MMTYATTHPYDWSSQRPHGIATWRDAIPLWMANRYIEPMAVGCLYAMAALPIPEKELIASTDYSNDRSGKTAERIDFFLEVAWYEGNKRIAEVAAQQLVRNLLNPALSNHSMPSAHDKILAFLKKKPSCLWRPPYPRLIAQYLAELHRNFEKHAEASSFTSSEYQAKFAAVIDDLVYAMCNWGLAYEVSRTSMFLKVMSGLRDFLGNTNLASEIRATFRPWGQSVIEDHTVFSVKQEIRSRAVIAFLQREHTHGILS